MKRALPPGLPFVYVESRDVLAIAGATLRPEAIALSVFGGIAAVATLLICGQVVTRRIRLQAAELDVARALGADPLMTFWDGLLGTLGAVLLGSGLAIVVAMALSPLTPFGPVRPYLQVGVRTDWAVLGLGVSALVLSLGAVAGLASLRAQPSGARRRTRGYRRRG